MRGGKDRIKPTFVREDLDAPLVSAPIVIRVNFYIRQTGTCPGLPEDPSYPRVPRLSHLQARDILVYPVTPAQLWPFLLVSN